MLGTNDLVFCSVPVSATPLLERLEPVKAAGFAGISLLPTDVWTLEAQGVPAAELSARIADSGLQVAEMDCAACWMDHHRTQGDGGELSLQLRALTAERVVDTAARVGARSVAAIDMGAAPPHLADAAESFARFCDLASRHGLLAHLEFLPASGIRSLSQAWAIVNAANRSNAGLTLDAWHFFRSGSTLRDLAKIPGESIHAVQLCDGPRTANGDAWTEMMTARLLPGEGDFDLVGLVGTLDTTGCRAPIGVEVFNARQQGQSIKHIARDWEIATRVILSQTRGLK